MKSTFKVLFLLKKKAVKRNGKAPVYALVTVDGRQSHFNTKLEVVPEDWDNRANKAKGQTTYNKQVNLNLDKIKLSLFNHYNHILTRKGYVTAEIVKNTFLGITEKERTVLEFFKL